MYRILLRHRLALTVWVGLLIAIPAHAHEKGAPFSGSIIDPLVLHHAHIENEQRLNLFYSRGVEGFGGSRRSSILGELEIAWSNNKFNLGAEMFVPIASLPSPSSPGTSVGIGDIETRPIKYALVNKPDFILSTATGVTLPTGSRRRGLGEGNTVLTQFLFMDKAIGNWFVGVNLGPSVNVTGDRGTGLEYGVVLSYSNIRGTQPGGLAASEPEQTWVVSPSIEFFGEKRLSGSDAGSNLASILPGIHFWNTRNGWQFHAGVALPVTGTRSSDRTFIFEVGNHFNWGDLFGRKKHDH